MIKRSGMTLALCLVSQPLHATDVGLQLDLKQEHYEIHGDSAQALAAAINAAGPMAPWGQRVAGYTTADITWQMRLLPVEGGCRVINANVTLRATVTSPTWVVEAGAPTSLKRHWPEFVAALARHEEEHMVLMRGTADRVRSVLAAPIPAETCDALEAVLDDAARREVQLGAALNRAFDASTRHGRSEGVDLGS